MESQNVEEYKGLRQEILTLKACITTYVGFVLLVVGPAFWELTKGMSGRPNGAMALFALMACFALKVVFLLLSYKFVSHNRYCGYCKLLEQEIFRSKDRDTSLDRGTPVDPSTSSDKSTPSYNGVSSDKSASWDRGTPPEKGKPSVTNTSAPKDIFIWEICLDRLRGSGYHTEGLEPEIQYYKGVLPLKETVLAECKRLSGRESSADSGRFYRGWSLLFSSKPEPRGTWQFPLHVARVFAAIDLGFVGLGSLLLLPSDLALWRQALHQSYFHYWFFGCSLLLLLWYGFMVALYKQMNGSETVDAFCWKFVPIRFRILEDMKVVNGYKLIAANPFVSYKPKVRGILGGKFAAGSGSLHRPSRGRGERTNPSALHDHPKQ